MIGKNQCFWGDKFNPVLSTSKQSIFLKCLLISSSTASLAETGIVSVFIGIKDSKNRWFSLSGMMLNGKPKTRDIDINNCNKVIIKILSEILRAHFKMTHPRFRYIKKRHRMRFSSPKALKNYFPYRH